MKKYALILTLALTGCATSNQSYQHYLTSKGLENQMPEQFQHCHGYGCKYIAQINFTQTDWNEINRVFRSTAKTPEAERAQIKDAIAIFEHKTGVQAGTSDDQWGTFRKVGKYQHDCVDESTNTTVYLSLLHQQGLIKHHTIESPSVRLPLIHSGRWPHQTAVISETATNEFFVVDSWFHDNGEKPEIVSLKEWKEGWKPDRAGETE